MANLLIETGSITGAARLVKRLTKYGDKNAQLINTPAALGGSGCSYSVRASLSSEQFVRNNLHGITVKKIYIEENNFGKRDYRDIS